MRTTASSPTSLSLPSFTFFHFLSKTQHTSMSLFSLTTLLSLLLSFPWATSSINNLHGSKQPNDAKLLATMSMDTKEKETLFQIMEAMSSDRNWRVSNPEPCRPGSSWPGIECKAGVDKHLHVTRLDFGNSPNPSCKQSATFPSEIFHLPYLQSLFFFNCFKTTKTSLSIPPLAHKPAAAAASSLQQLSLRSNPALVGVIPPHLSSLTSLQVLTLSQNHLFGKIPEGISLLTSLVHLDLSYNNLTGSIPSQLGELRSLVGLDLSYNSIAGSIPQSIGQMALLQKLDLSSNALTGSIPETLQSLGLLSFLALSNNRLSGQFPESLPKLQNLQYFIMDDNPMSVSLPSHLGKLARLQELRLANSGYTGSIPESFAMLTNLTTLSLENNRLKGEIPAGLSGLSRIYHLNLSRNFLGGVVPFNTNFLRRLGRNLDLSGNPGLCLSKSTSSEGMKAGIGVCGANRSSSVMQQPLETSNGVPSLNSNISYLLFAFMGFLTMYHLILF